MWSLYKSQSSSKNLSFSASYILPFLFILHSLSASATRFKREPQQWVREVQVPEAQDGAHPFQAQAFSVGFAMPSVLGKFIFTLIISLMSFPKFNPFRFSLLNYNIYHCLMFNFLLMKVILFFQREAKCVIVNISVRWVNFIYCMFFFPVSIYWP